MADDLLRDETDRGRLGPVPVWLVVALVGGLLLWLGLRAQKARQLAEDPTIP